MLPVVSVVIWVRGVRIEPAIPSWLVRKYADGVTIQLRHSGEATTSRDGGLTEAIVKIGCVEPCTWIRMDKTDGTVQPNVVPMVSQPNRFNTKASVLKEIKRAVNIIFDALIAYWSEPKLN